MPEVVQTKRTQPAEPVVDPVEARIEKSLQRLKPEQAEAIRRILNGDSGAEPELQGDIDRFRKSEGLRGASEPALDKIFAAMAANPADPITAVFRPLREKNFAQLSSEEQCAVLDIALKSPSCAEGISILLGRKNEKGEPLLTSERDSQGRTLLANLTALVQATPHADISAADAMGTKRVAYEVMMEVARPTERVDQGNRGACAAASIQDIICRRQPAEYVRLVTGLLVDKTVDARGGKLAAVEGSLKPGSPNAEGVSDLRSLAERSVVRWKQTHAEPGAGERALRTRPG